MANSWYPRRLEVANHTPLAYFNAAGAGTTVISGSFYLSSSIHLSGISDTIRIVGAETLSKKGSSWNLI